MKRKTQIRVKGLDHCIALCTAGVNKDCLAWTFQPTTKLCWLKKVFAEKQVALILKTSSTAGCFYVQSKI